MTIFTSFLESSLNLLFNNLKKHYEIEYSQVEKRCQKFEPPETQFSRTVTHKIACKAYLECKNDSFKHIFGILIKFPIQ